MDGVDHAAGLPTNIVSIPFDDLGWADLLSHGN